MLRYVTAGESHGKGLIAILDGVPAGLFLDREFINSELARRMVGYGRGERMNIEKDMVDIIAGCRKGSTIGSPVGMFIYNKDHTIDELPEVKHPRPGHADLVGMLKYGTNDARNILERASARETAARVAAGAVAKLILERFGIRIFSHVTMIGGVEASLEGLTMDDICSLAEQSEVRCADKKAAKRMCEKIDKAKSAGDTLGGTFEVVVSGVPVGLGSYAQWDKRLDGAIARAVVSIPAVKAVSIGGGIEAAGKKGSEAHDEIEYDSVEKIFKRKTNNAGGIEGGISNGQPIIVKGFMKPIATLSMPLKTVDIDTKEESLASRERADVTAVAACGVVAEAVLAVEIASVFTDKFGSDSIAEIERNFRSYMESLKKI